MDVVLVRHAIACPRDADRWPDDDDRPLAPDAMPRARKAAAGLRRLLQRPHRVLTSPLLRARQTAALLSEHAHWPRAILCGELAPGHPAEGVLAVLRHEPGKLIAVIGHQPSLSEVLALALPGGRPEGFQMKRLGAALLTFSAAPRSGAGTLAWLVPPRILRAAR